MCSPTASAQRGQPHRQPVGGEKLPDRLLLHVGFLVGQRRRRSACIAATNSWLHAQTRHSQYPYDNDRGYVCTLSAMVIKSTTAHIFHVGDARIYRLAGTCLEQLTEDHRVVVSSEQSYLGRALGMNPQIEIDYRAVPLDIGDSFVLATDGVYEHVERHISSPRPSTQRATTLTAPREQSSRRPTGKAAPTI